MGKLKHYCWFTILKYLLLPLLACIFTISISSIPSLNTPNNQSSSFIANIYSNTNIVNEVQNLKQAANLEFIENRGQIIDIDGMLRPDIAYVADGNGVKLYFTTTGVSYVFTKIEKSEAKNVSKFEPGFRKFERDELENSPVTSYRMDMKLLDSNPNVRIYAEEETEGYFNYYYAHCPDGILGVKGYKRLIYENIYDNIDLVFFDSKMGMEYDFVVKPDGNVQNIQFQYEGAEQVNLLANGKLKIVNPLGQIIENEPKSFTGKNLHNDNTVKSSYRLESNIIGFEISDYDTNQTLIIDPELAWATYYGGTERDNAYAVTIDRDMNIVITGHTWSADFPVTIGAFQTSSEGYWDALIVKLDKNGGRLWVTYYGGEDYDFGRSIASDINGNVVINGDTYSADFPVTNGAFQTNYAGEKDFFIVKFSNNGSRQWATYYGGSNQDDGSAVAFDANENVLITGDTYSTDFPVTNDAFQTTYAGEWDAFIVKFSSSGSRQWATYYGGNDPEAGASVATDRNGNVVITGVTTSADFPVTNDAFQISYAGKGDPFIVRFDSSGSRQWATYYGGSLDDRGWGIATDGDDNVVIIGETSSSNFSVTTGAFQDSNNGYHDVFIVKFSSSGKRQWATYYGGFDGDEGRGIATDLNGNIVITGRTYSPDFPVTSNAFQTTHAGNWGIFIVKFTDSGSRKWASYYGGAHNDQGYGVAIDRSGNMAITGTTDSTDFPVTTGAFQTNHAGMEDAFIVKFLFNPVSPPTLSSPVNGTIDLSTSPRLSWNAVDDALSYRLQVSVNSDFTKMAFDSSEITTTSAAATGLSDGTTYYWRVNAEGEFVSTDWSEVWSFRTNLSKPDSPVLMSPLDSSIGISSSPTLIWHASENAESYRLQISVSADFSTTLFDESGITETFKKTNKLGNNKKYYWRVCASNKMGPSLWSNVCYFITVPILNLDTTISFPQYNTPSEYEATDYKIVGLPGASDLPVDTLFSVNPRTDWQAYWDNGSSSNDPQEYLVKFEKTSIFQFSAGRAFWLIKKGNLRIIKDVEAVSLIDSRYAAIPVHFGWNLITNPFLTPISWFEVEAINDSINPIWKYSGVKSFSDTTVFEPYVGYYFYADSSLSTLKIPYPYNLEKPIASEDNSQIESWRLNVSLSSGKFVDKTLSFGVSKQAKIGLDKLDFRKPRGIASVPTVSFQRPEWDPNYSTFATDIRPEGEKIESWDFEVRGVHQQNSQLEFKGIEQIPEPMQIYLVDEARGESINLLEHSSYDFMGIGDVMKFQVVVGQLAAVKDKLNEINIPKKFALENNYPNPFNPETTIPVEIPVAADVTLRIYNVLGQEVKMIYQGSVEPGRYQFTWDGRDQAGNVLASGVYILHLSTNTRISLTSKMILMQ